MLCINYVLIMKKQIQKVSTFNSCESSETIRKALIFSFDDFYAYGHASHVPRISESFLEWFIGFFEGDGSLSYTCGTAIERSHNGKISTKHVYERVMFSICQKEKRIIEKIAYTFGFGSVSNFKNKNEQIYWRWTLDSKISIERMAFLLSGNLIFKKRQHQFLQWIEIGQKKGMFQAPFNKNKPWCSDISLNNAWLSGFIDAQGYFYACFSLPKLQKKKIFNLPFSKKKWSEKHYKMFLELEQYKYILKQKMTLTQHSTNQTKHIFKKILFIFKATTFQLFQNKISQKPSYSYYVRIEFGSLTSHKIISEYLLKYPLQTIKHISFRRWWRVYLRRKEGIHLSPKATQRLSRLVKAINHHANET